MRGRASSTPKVPWESVTGSLTPRASHRLSASRSNVNAQAARLPCGQRTVIAELARARLRSGRAVPRDGEAQREPTAMVLPELPRTNGRTRRGPAGEAVAPRAVGSLVLGGQRLDERRIVLDLAAAAGVEVAVGRPRGLLLEWRRHHAGRALDPGRRLGPDLHAGRRGPGADPLGGNR